MKSLRLIFLITTIFLSCKFAPEEKNLDRIKEEVASNIYFKNYVKVVNQFLYKEQIGEINLEFADRNLIKMGYPDARNPEDLKVLFKNAGVVGADELVTLRYAASFNLKKLMNAIPQLEELDKRQLKYVMSFKFRVTQPGIDPLFLEE